MSKTASQPADRRLTYLADSSSLINLIGGASALTRPRSLLRLARDGRLRIPQSVCRELRRRDDRLRDWIERNRKHCELVETAANTSELARISRDHRMLIGQKQGAADAVLIALAINHLSRSWFVLADDAGVQACCVLEGVRYVTSSAFCRLEGI